MQANLPSSSGTKVKPVILRSEVTKNLYSCKQFDLSKCLRPVWQTQGFHL